MTTHCQVCGRVYVCGKIHKNRLCVLCMRWALRLESALADEFLSDGQPYVPDWAEKLG